MLVQFIPDIESIFKNTNSSKNIIIKKNIEADNLFEIKNGATLYFRISENRIIQIKGYFKDDLLNISHTINFIKKIYENLNNKINEEVVLIPSYFKSKYIEILSIRDIMVTDYDYIIKDIQQKYNDFKNLQSKPLLVLSNEFLIASKHRKIDILTLLLMSNNENKKLANELFELLQNKENKSVSDEIYKSLHYTSREYLQIINSEIKEDIKKLKKLTENDIPYEKRINLMNVNDDIKAKAMEKLKSIKSNFQGDSKSQAWLDGLLKIPFNNHKQNKIISFINEFREKINSDFSLETFLYSIIPLYRNIAGRDIRIKTWTEKNCEKINTNAIFFYPGNFSINRLEHELKNVIKSIRIIISSSTKKSIDEEKVRAVIEKKYNFYNNDYKIYNFTVTNQNIHFDTVCLLYETSKGVILGADYTTSSVENREFYLNTIKYLSDFMITQDASRNSSNFFNHNFFIIRSLIENVNEDFEIKVKSLTLCNINLLRDVSKFLGIFYKFIPIAQSNILIVKVI